MSAIYHVLTNLKYNGTDYPAGAFVQSETTEFDALVAKGLVEVVPGAKTVADAQAIVTGRVLEEAAEEAEAEAEAPKDTWGPTPSETQPEVTEEDVPTAPQEPETVPAPETLPEEENVTDAEIVTDENAEPTAPTAEEENGDNL
jgi:hypothetical protein